MNPDTYFDGDNPPGALEDGEFRMLGDELGANLMMVKKAGAHWTLALIGGPSVNVGRAKETWPTIYVQQDGALLVSSERSSPGYLPIPFRVEDTVPLGINLYEYDPADPTEVFDRAFALADEYRKRQ